VIPGPLRYRWRVFARTPGFTLAAIGALALGISASLAIFTVVDAVMLRPLPYADPGRLVLLSTAEQPFSYPRFTYMQEKSRSFAAMAAFTSEVFTLTGQGDPEQIAAARVSWQFFDVLGVHPALGRAFAAGDDRPGARDVAILSHRLWVRRFSAQPDIAGRSVSLDGKDFTVIGVLPAGFRFAPLGTEADLWAAKVFDLSLTTPSAVAAGAGFLSAIARLAPGVELVRAQAEQDTLASQYRAAYPNHPDSGPHLRLTAVGLQRAIAADLRPALFLLSAAVGLLLFIACANVSNLLLSRAAGRAREMSIRAALGASRWDIVRQLLEETLILGAAGGAAGLLLARWSAAALVSLSHSPALGLADLRIDWRVVLFALALSLGSSLLCGLAPALHLSRPGIFAALRETGRTPAGSRVRGALILVQVSLSVVLLAASGLLIRSFVALRATDPGFRPQGVLTMQLSLPATRYAAKPSVVQFYRRALDALRAVPGVRAAAISSALPLHPTRLSPALMEGQPAVPLAQRPIVHIQTISPDYAEVLGVPLLRGRSFTPQDDAQAPTVAIVNQKLARRFWPGEDAIGKRIWIGRMAAPAQVVGVFGDVANQSLASDTEPEIMLPFPQLPWPLLHISLLASADPRSIAAAARTCLLGLDQDQPVTEVQTGEDLMAAAGAQPRFHMVLVGAYSGAALLIALIGVYGLAAYSTAQRTREMGVRIALGASRADILAAAGRQTLRLVLIGILLGVAAALAVTRLMAALLYRTPASDPAALLAAGLLFAVAGAIATCIPALRATRVDPCQSLRHE